MSSPTDQTILDALRTAYYNLVVKGSKSYSANGRMFTSLDLPELQKQISIFEARVDATTYPGIGAGTLLAQFNDTGRGRS